MTNYKDLEVWKKAMGIIKEIYLLCRKYPKEETYALTSQTKRAAVSIAANIAEGCGRRTKKDTTQFLFISRGSFYELETLLNIAVMIEVITETDFDVISRLIDENLRLLNGLIRRYEDTGLV